IKIMDLLCSESVLTDLETANKCKKQTPAIQKTAVHQNNFNCTHNGSSSSCCLSPSITSKKPGIGSFTKCRSAKVAADSNINKLMYVFTSVTTSVCSPNKTKQIQREKSGSYQPINQLPQQEMHKTLFTPPTSSNATGSNINCKFLKAHVAVTDPIFTTDRCLENALKCEEKQPIIETYFKTVQKDITPPMRKIVAEWMMEVN
ncbi:hypothetical protein KR222_000018, partial [Zaprionus bogoriensis]